MRVGEPFSVVLTCALIDTDSLKVVPDESRLDPNVILFPPFDLLDGRRETDLTTDQHRFFQYDYTLRLIAEDQFGEDVELPTTSISYRVRSRTEDGDLSEGREQSYELPVQSIRILSLVPDDATGIREGLAGAFRPVESRLFRGSVLRLVGAVFFGLAALMAVAAVVRLIGRHDVKAQATEAHIPDWIVRRRVRRELAAVQQQRQQAGWTPELEERALAAIRIVAGYRLSHLVAQLTARHSDTEGDGALRVEARWLGRKPMWVSSAVTAQAVADRRRCESDAGADSSYLQLLEELEHSLASFTAAQYGREETPGDAVLDTSLTTGLDQLRRMDAETLRRLGRSTGPFPYPVRAGHRRLVEVMPEALATLLESVRANMADWGVLRIEELSFRHRDAASLTLVVLVGVTVMLLVARSVARQRPRHGRLALPALADGRRSRLSVLRHSPLLVFLVGLPFFFAAVADPYTPMGHVEVSAPGRRIALSDRCIIEHDVSISSRSPKRTGSDRGHFLHDSCRGRPIRSPAGWKGGTGISSRLSNSAMRPYVITPFTNDYENVLLSLSLIGDWTEFMHFPDQGTTIGLAIEQSLNLFDAFDFLDASGNLMVIFSDGHDSEVTVRGKRVMDVLAGAIHAKVPVYFIRTNYNKALGQALPDRIWKPAIESTGGRFYAAADEGNDPASHSRNR